MDSVAESRFFSDATTWRVPAVMVPFSEMGQRTVKQLVLKGCAPQELDTMLLGLPNEIGIRGVALENAIFVKNLPLIRHILDRWPELVNGGAPFSWLQLRF